MSVYEPVSSSVIAVTTNRMRVPGRSSQVVWYIAGMKDNSTTGDTISWTLDRPFYLESIDSFHVTTLVTTTVNVLSSVAVSIVPPVGEEIVIYKQFCLEAPQNFGVLPASQIVQSPEWKKQDFGLVLDTGTIIKVTVYATPVGIMGSGCLGVLIFGRYMAGGTIVNG